MFEPGNKVICIDGTFPPDIRDYFNALPEKGVVYTVRDVVPGLTGTLKEEPAVYLEELVNLPNQHGIEPGFACRRFRELDPEEEEQLEEADMHIRDVLCSAYQHSAIPWRCAAPLGTSRSP